MRAKTVSRKSAPAPVATRPLHLVPQASPSNEEIAVRAYLHYLDRGMTHGHDVEDWLSAKDELEREMDGEKMAGGL